MGKLLHSNRDYQAGALLLACGLAVAWQGHTYEVGSLEQMGPGFVPVSLGVILVLLGIAIALNAARSVAPVAVQPTQPIESAKPMDLRAGALILLSVALFIVLGHYGGLIPATFATVFVSALGDKENTWRSAIVLAAVMSVVCLVVFHWALQVQLSLFHWG